MTKHLLLAMLKGTSIKTIDGFGEIPFCSCIYEGPDKKGSGFGNGLIQSGGSSNGNGVGKSRDVDPFGMFCGDGYALDTFSDYTIKLMSAND
jgi:hypothetical protein